MSILGQIFTTTNLLLHMPSATEETFRIRRLSLNDVLEGNFLNVLAELTTVHSPERPLSKETLTKRFQSMDPTLYHIIVLVRSSDDRIVGAATLLIEEKFIHECGRVGHIEDVVVSKDARGGGFGKQLIDHLINIAKESNCYKTILDCDEKNVAFYEKCGMERKGIQMALYYE